jgi:hypothetical protein
MSDMLPAASVVAQMGGRWSKAMAREVEEAVSNARDRFEREMEQKLKDMERRHRPSIHGWY